MATISPYPRFRALLDDGSPAVGYKVYSYLNGSTTPKATYTDQSGTVANANPVVLDGAGEADVWFGSGGYKLVLADVDDAVVWTLDSLNIIDDLSVVDLTASGSTSLQATSVTTLAVSSTDKVTNLNADQLDSGDWAHPGAIGATTPNSVAATTVSASTSLTVGAGTALTLIKVYAPSLTPVACAANTTAEQTFTVAGLTTADAVIVNKPTAQAGLGIVGVRVSAADTLAITFSNNTGSPITPTAAETYKVVAIRS